MAGYIEGAVNDQTYSFGKGRTRARNNTTISYPNNNQANIYVEGAVRSGDDACNWYRLADFATTVQVGQGGVNGTGGSWHSTVGIYNYCNWVGVIGHTYTVNRGSADTSCTTWTKYWGGGNANYGTAKNSGELYNSVVVAKIPAEIPPVVTNVKFSRTNDATLVLSWTNNGSGLSAPAANYVDGRTNDGSWGNLSKNTLITSYTWSGTSANNKYQMRVNSYNSAGQNTHQETGIIYTTPAAPKSISNAVAVIQNGSQELSFNIDKSNTNYPHENIDFQYSNDNSTWRGSGGTVNAVYRVSALGSAVLPASSMDATLKTYINNMKTGGKLYIRARTLNADQSLASSFTSSLSVAFNERSLIYFWVPDGTNVNNVRIYVNKP